MAKRTTRRPTQFTSAIAKAIGARLAAGETLRAICRDPAMPREAVVRGWAAQRPAFAGELRRARELGYATLADELLEIADAVLAGGSGNDKGRGRPGTDAVQCARLRIETRKWLLARALPGLWGERPDAGEKAAGERPLSYEALVLASIKESDK
ncbi:terminase small subunit protein [Enhydrobacter sp.]|jgi:hypothetical protein|uniref:terminase small subunit-like protein n=1 Tax=Enhydrobacter sp. TaxID=1894999 RepID=UPI002632976C|nr:terminase small subunit protein [Enhydrobacter sp.]WIM09064.1 MAG: hypothetical protein OJF58_000015 [Enhydrobacter sp.]